MTSAPRRWDQQWVPRAAQQLRAGLAWLGRPFGAPDRTGRQALRAVQEEPALAGSIAVVLVAAVLLATVGEGGPPDDIQGRPLVTLPPPVATATLGPGPGDSVGDYLERADDDLRQFGRIAAQRRAYAIVDLRSYERAREVERLFAHVDVVRVYVRVPSRLPTEVRSVPLNDVEGLREGLGTVAAVARATARSYGALLRSFTPRSPEDRRTHRRYVLQRRASVVEAARLRHPATCRCVFAVVVQAGYLQLKALASTDAVRVVDPAAPVVPLTGLTIRPLQPQVRAVVPRAGLVGG